MPVRGTEQLFGLHEGLSQLLVLAIFLDSAVTAYGDTTEGVSAAAMAPMPCLEWDADARSDLAPGDTTTVRLPEARVDDGLSERSDLDDEHRSLDWIRRTAGLSGE